MCVDKKNFPKTLFLYLHLYRFDYESFFLKLHKEIANNGNYGNCENMKPQKLRWSANRLPLYTIL